MQRPGSKPRITNENNTVLYTGVTNNLERRVAQHKKKEIPGFTKKYNCTKLVWFEQGEEILGCIEAEKRIKKWKRSYKENLINKKNPGWVDLAEEVLN